MGRLIRSVLVTLSACAASAVLCADPLPIFDAHMHYNIEARAPYPPAALIEIFRKNNVRGILANSRPNDGSELLMKAAPASGSLARVAKPLRVCHAGRGS